MATRFGIDQVSFNSLRKSRGADDRQGSGKKK